MSHDFVYIEDVDEDFWKSRYMGKRKVRLLLEGSKIKRPPPMVLNLEPLEVKIKRSKTRSVIKRNIKSLFKRFKDKNTDLAFEL